MVSNSEMGRLNDWRPLKHELHAAVVEKRLPVQLIFPPQHQNGIVRLEGVFLSVSNNVARFEVTSDDEITIKLKDGELPADTICRVSIRIDPGLLPADSLVLPGEYVSNAVVTFLKGDRIPVEKQQDSDITQSGDGNVASADNAGSQADPDGQGDESAEGQDQTAEKVDTSPAASSEDRKNGDAQASGQAEDAKEYRYRPTYLELRISHQYMMRKTRKFDRTIWRASEASLVRLLVASPVPRQGKDLQDLLAKAMRQPDQSQDLVDISEGGALIHVAKQIAQAPLLLEEAYLMLFSLHRQEQALPIVFLAKKAGLLSPDKKHDGKQGLRLHFVSELDWNASTRQHLVWRDIDKTGSEELSLVLQVSDKRGWLED